MHVATRPKCVTRQVPEFEGDERYEGIEMLDVVTFLLSRSRPSAGRGRRSRRRRGLIRAMPTAKHCEPEQAYSHAGRSAKHGRTRLYGFVLGEQTDEFLRQQSINAAVVGFLVHLVLCVLYGWGALTCPAWNR